ncbi:Cellobiose 2-epimerase [bioreactor metagenome]|uniref:Cellobiose 2-epimerase n=1 Tax=bioreactor metagenome TaxID=1076179 RepID=A0A645HDT7_9ZZZZ
MWFILDYLTGSGDTARVPEVINIIAKTLEFGWDRQYGGIFYFMDVLGKPHLELQHDMKLWWVHNEATIATLYAYKVTRDPRFLDWFRKVDEWSFGHFPDSEYGEWFAYLNRRGEPTHMLKGGKWKTFFHLPRCLAFSAALMEELK